MQIPFPLLPKNKWYKVTNSPSKKIFPSFSKPKIINCLSVTIYGLNKKKAPLIGAFSERNFKHKYNVKVSN